MQIDRYTKCVAGAAKKVLVAKRGSVCSSTRLSWKECYGDADVWGLHEGEIVHCLLHHVCIPLPLPSNRVTCCQISELCLLALPSQYASAFSEAERFVCMLLPQ